MSQSPLTLEHYYYTRSLVALKKAYINGDKDMPEGIMPIFDVDTQVTRHSQDGRAFRVKLEVRANKSVKTFPFEIEVSIVGFFRVLEGFPDEMIDQLVGTNATSILYSTAREHVAMLTSRSSLYLPFVLPSISFFKTEEDSGHRDQTKPKKLASKKKPALKK